MHYDPSFERLSAGSLLTAHVLENMSRAGVRSFDCGPGLHDWKKTLAASSVPTLEIMAGSPCSLLGSARAGWIGMLKPWIKRRLQRVAV
jgi:CelD/BcsL family acetyltransferase involved in cellulose biosynthesis